MKSVGPESCKLPTTLLVPTGPPGLGICSDLTSEDLGLEGGQLLWFLNGTGVENCVLSPAERRAAAASLAVTSSHPLAALGGCRSPLSSWETKYQAFLQVVGSPPVTCALLQGPLGGTRLLLFDCPHFKASLIPASDFEGPTHRDWGADSLPLPRPDAQEASPHSSFGARTPESPGQVSLPGHVAVLVGSLHTSV